MKTKQLIITAALLVLSSALSVAALSTTFTNPTPAINDSFGWAVAAVGAEKVLVGAPSDDTGAANAGAAYLFGTNGTLLITFTNPAPADSDSFGFAAAAVGPDKVLIGAYGDDTGATDAGAAYLFSTNGTLLTTFTNPTPAASEIFGFSVVGVGSDKVLISAVGDDTGATDAGVAYLFNTSGTLLTTFTNPMPATLDNFGQALAAVGPDRVLIGVPRADRGGTDVGVAYLLSTSGTLLTTFTNPTPAASDYFGHAVTGVGADKVLISAYQDDTGATDAGAAYLFSTNGTLLNTFSNPAPATSDWFGRTVAGVGGDKVLIGTPYDGTDSGTVYLFHINGALLTTINNPTPASSDLFGVALGVAGGRLPLIGASGDRTGATGAGAAYLFSAYSGPPSVTTLPASSLASSNATLAGLVSPNGSAATAWFEWGETTSYGSSTAATNVGSADEAVNFQTVLRGLSPGLTYHYRAVATNSAGSSLGADQSFAIPLLVVTTVNDSGAGSLRQAIADAPSGATLIFAVTGTITVTNGELTIAQDLSIIGPGATNLAISGGFSNRVFAITNTQARVSLSGLTMRDGHAKDGTNGVNGASNSGAAGTAGSDGQPGGGIYNCGTLALTGCMISSNSAGRGGTGGTGGSGSGASGTGGRGGNGGSGGMGGGIYNSGTLTLTRCTVSGNAAGSGGGGGSGGSGAPTSGRGGNGGTGGNGGWGGGVYSYVGVETMNCSTLSGNLAGGGGSGGIAGGRGLPLGSPGSPGFGGAGGSGGGVYAFGATELINCTVSSNSVGAPGLPASGASGVGGGIQVYDYASVRLFNTLVALNVGPTSAPDVSGSVFSVGHNLIAITNGVVGTFTNGDLVSLVDPKLGPLAANGGPTLTHALLPGSPALEAGDDAVLLAPYNLASDQRGLPRKMGYHVDIGAFESSNPGITLPAAAALGATLVATNPLSGTLTAILNGSVSSGGAAFCDAFMEYGLTTGYGGFTGITNVLGVLPTPISGGIAGLGAALKFHYRVVASNIIGVAVSPDQAFVTPPLLPPGDTSGDGVVDQGELDVVLASYWPTSPWLYLTNTAGLGEAHVTFALTNSTAGAYSVLMSTNLLDWDYLGPATPRYEFTDTNAPALPQRYYRLRWP